MPCREVFCGPGPGHPATSCVRGRHHPPGCIGIFFTLVGVDMLPDRGLFRVRGRHGTGVVNECLSRGRVSGMSSAAYIPPGVIFTAPVHISRETVERAVDPANGMPALCGMAPPWNNAQPWLRRTPGTQSRAAAFLYYMIRRARHPGGTTGIEAGGLPQVSGHAIWLSGMPNSRTLELWPDRTLEGGGPHMPSRGARRAPAATPSRSTGTARGPRPAVPRRMRIRRSTIHAAWPGRRPEPAARIDPGTGCICQGYAPAKAPTTPRHP